MVYQFLLLSDEVADFARVISINSDATFFQLHQAILASVGYSQDEMTSFFTCSSDWEKETEITLIDMGKPSEEDVYLMSDTKLDEFIEDIKQRLIYIFDPLAERVFFLELREIFTDKNLPEAIINIKKGIPPSQKIDFTQEDLSSITGDIDENFYGDEDFDMDELDEEGFDNLGSSNGSYDEEYY